jgi:hypothetical protein
MRYEEEQRYWAAEQKRLEALAAQAARRSHEAFVAMIEEDRSE